MNINFPIIKSLDDVLPYIKGRDEFKVSHKDDYTVVSYLVAYEDTFLTGDQITDAIRRECRGLIFDKQGAIISRPYHKFFNVGELEETQPSKLDLTKEHTLLQKLDGSMVRPIPLHGTFRLGTKAGITRTSMNAEVWLANKPNYIRFINDMLKLNLTPIFEWCSRKDRIVIDYPQDKMVLTAIRHNVTGEYYPFYLLAEHAELFKLDSVCQAKADFSIRSNLADITQWVRGLTDDEGIVIRFNSGAMYKLKADDYVRLHKSKDLIKTDLGKLTASMYNSLDDLKPVLSEADYKDLVTFNIMTQEELRKSADLLETLFLNWYSDYPDKKDFAVNFASKLTPLVKSIMFLRYRELGRSTEMISILRDLIENNLTNQKGVDKTRMLWDNNTKLVLFEGELT